VLDQKPPHQISKLKRTFRCSTIRERRGRELLVRGTLSDSTNRRGTGCAPRRDGVMTYIMILISLGGFIYCSRLPSYRKKREKEPNGLESNSFAAVMTYIMRVIS